MARILLITPYFYPHKGGSQQYAFEFYSQLMKSDPTIQVDVLCYNTDNTPQKESYKGFTIYRVPTRELLPGQFALPDYISLISLLHKLKKEHTYTFINAHTRFFESSWWAPLAAWYLGTKSILTDHCAYHPTHTSAFVRFIAATADRIIAPLISYMYTHVTVVSRATYDFTLKLGMKKPLVIYGGVDTTLFKPEQDKKIRTFPSIKNTFTHDDIIISFVGRMIPAKGPQLLIKVAEVLVEKYNNVSFIFTGNGPLFESLKKHSSSRIYFTGQRDTDEVAQILSQTDIFVHPSTHHEGLPIALLEAGAAGCAIIATDQGGTREVIINKKTGLLIKPHEIELTKALEELITDETERKNMGQAVRKKVEEEFNWDTSIKKFKTAFATLLTTN